MCKNYDQQLSDAEEKNLRLTVRLCLRYCLARSLAYEEALHQDVVKALEQELLGARDDFDRFRREISSKVRPEKLLLASTHLLQWVDRGQHCTAKRSVVHASASGISVGAARSGNYVRVGLACVRCDG